ncbi:MAG: 3-hydroxybutyrate dehydrogenase [Vicinamibacteria bacterium]|jgi:3-hydroxybutyrate dehydrogenase
MTSRRTALITGSTSGIGAGIAEALARDGHDIVLNGLGDASAIEAQRAALERAHGVKVRFVHADMAKPQEIEAMMKRAGAVDVLVNNAGIQHVAAVDEFPPEKWDAILAINLSATFHATRLAIPSMKAKGWGRIINIASAHGLIASAYKAPYVAAKHGVVGFTKSVALEVAQAGITVNAICPGYVRTPLVEAQIPDQARKHGLSEADVVQKVMLAEQPTRRFIDIDEVARLAAYLVSDAARSITGTAVTIDGGWTAH